MATFKESQIMQANVYGKNGSVTEGLSVGEELVGDDGVEIIGFIG